MQKRYFIIVLLLLNLFRGELTLHSKEVRKKYISFEIILEKSVITKASSSFYIAIKAKMDKGWHIYWKNPGDGGRETRIKLTLPSALKETGEFWPYPRVFNEAGFSIYGYSDTVYFLYKITTSKELPKEARKVKIKALVDYLICEKVCLPPNEANLNTYIGLGEKEVINPKWKTLYKEIANNIPKEASINITAGKIQSTKKDKEVYIKLGSSFLQENNINKESGLYFFSREKNIVRAGKSQRLVKKENDYYLTLKVKKYPSFLSGVLSLPDKNKAFAIKNLSMAEKNTLALYKEANNPKSTMPEDDISVWFALLFGFIGGLILNLMPCVFPVLSLKVLGFVEQAGENKLHIRLHGIIFTLGVLISFWILVFFLVSFKEAGDIQGWGYQLQNSLVVMILGFFFLIFALNLFGIFEIGLSFSRLGEGGQNNNNAFIKSFITGVLVTIAATPCSAPFLGSAIGFTIAQPISIIFLVFTFIALGLSAPYLFLSFFPSFLKFLPKPGKWMESFKQSMGFLLIATVVFLVWVLGKQSSVDDVLYYLFALIIVSVGFWIYGRWNTFGKKNIISLVLSFAFVVSGFSLSYFTYSNIGKEDTSSIIEWQAFSKEKIEQLKSNGEIVFIDFTAAWCLTCQTNKIALRSKEIETKFKELNIKSFVADWTKKDITIGKELKKLGRNAVPVYVFYLGKQDTIIMPVILTKDIILRYLDEVQKKM